MPPPPEPAYFRRLLWRAGRRIYSAARRDRPSDDIASNGEGRLQRDVVRMLARRKQSATVFDVGANVGDWTRSFLAARAVAGGGFDLALHAFEPVPDTHRTLLANLARLSDRACVVPVAQALSGVAGTADIHAGGSDAGTNSLYADPLRPGRAAIRIELTTADLYARDAGLADVHFMKCDTEGHDCEVLLGARGLLRARRLWAVQFEYNYVWVASRHYLKDVFDLVADLDYCLGKVTPSRVEILAGWHPELERFFAANYVLIRNDLLDEFVHRRLVRDGSNTWA